MSEPIQNPSTRQIGSLLVAAFFVIAGAVTLYDTTSYSDIDSKVFPRAAAILLIVCSLASILMSLLRTNRASASTTDSNEPGFGEGSWWRRCLLVASMLSACVVMPYVGFLAAGTIAFAGGLIAGMHQRWTAKTIAVYAGSGAVLMVGFYALFRFALSVPLP